MKGISKLEAVTALFACASWISMRWSDSWLFDWARLF
jgi:hypothetical protein